MTASSIATGWSCPDIGLTLEQQAAVTECVTVLRSGGQPLLGAFLGGSLAVGLGHSYSDLDVHIVTDGEWDRSGSALRSHTASARFGMQIQFNPLRLDEAQRLIDTVSTFSLTASGRSQMNLSDTEISNLTRMVTGWWIFRAPGHFADFPGSNARHVLRKLMMARAARAVVALCEDSYGSMAANDYRTAVRCAALALEHACETVLAAADDLYPATKFLHRRLKRCAATEPIADAVWGLLGGLPPISADSGQVRLFIEASLHAATGIVSHALLDGWEAPIRTCPLPSRSTSGPARNPAYSMMRFDDGIGITGLDRSFRVSESMARLWLGLDAGMPGPGNRHADRIPGRNAAEVDAIKRLGQMGVAVLPSVPELSEIGGR